MTTTRSAALAAAARTWANRSAPTVATPLVIARTLGAFYVVGGLGGAAAAWPAPGLPLPHPPLLLLAAFAVATGTALVLAGHRLPRAAFHVVVASATAAITASVLLGGGGVLSTALAVSYVFIALDAFFFFAWRGAVAHLGAAVVCCVVVTPGEVGSALPTGVLLGGVVLAIGAVVGVLVRLAADADVDALTALANRRGFDRRVEVELDRAVRTGRPLSVALIDLDHFKAVNDLAGHAAGDDALRAVAAAWRSCAPPGSLMARFGGDEFTVLLPHTGEELAVQVVAGLRAALPGQGFSAGVTSWRRGETASTLLGRADAGLYRAKVGGRGVTALEPAAATARGAELAEAVRAGAIDVHYQPVVRLDGCATVTGVEALARWTSPSAGRVAPDEFIALAEREGLIHDLGALVLHRACADGAALRAALGRELTIAVNVSGLQLVEGRLLDDVASALAGARWPAQQLVLEVTEGQLDADSTAAAAVLAELRASGVRIAIDDFGNGYSSLGRLDTMPVDVLKLDASFVRRVEHVDDEVPVLAAVAALGQVMGKVIVVEGVETAAQAAVVTALGMDHAQGYHYARPAPLEELVADWTSARGPAARVAAVRGAVARGAVVRGPVVDGSVVDGPVVDGAVVAGAPGDRAAGHGDVVRGSVVEGAVAGSARRAGPPPGLAPSGVEQPATPRPAPGGEP